MNPINAIWTEKYRPSKVSMMVGDFKEKILKYLEKQESIPHFLLHSKTPGTGKCLTGDEMFLTNNGLISFEDYCKNNNINTQYTDKCETIFDVENNFVNSEYFYKAKDETLKINTKHGYDIKGTKNHKIKVFDLDEGLIWKKLKDIKINDLVPIFYNTKIFGNNNELKNIRQRINKRDHSSIIIKVPNKINNDIAYFLGVFTANGLFSGDGVNISTKKDWLYDKIGNIINKNFKIKIGKFKKDNCVFRCGGLNLKKFLIESCGCSKDTARKKYIPKKIFECSENIQMNFINGLLEDSWISKEGYIEYGTASNQLAKEVKLLLLNLGFIVRHTEKYLKEYDHIYHSLTMPVEHSKNFIDYFNGKYKNNKIRFNEKTNTNILSYKLWIRNYVRNQRRKLNLTKFEVKNRHLTPISNIGVSIELLKSKNKDLYKEIGLEELKIFFDKNIFLTPVSEIYDNGMQDIYDFHIPKTHSFLASGIINHNTTLAKAIINELGCDSLVLNSSDDRKIEVIRDKVKEFAITQSSKKGMRRCVFMDEFDGMLTASQNALRNLMESYAGNVFFILTCNNINKVIEPLQSRCVVIPFAYPKREEVKKYLIDICEKESMDYTDNGIDLLIELNYPSIRNCVIVLQDLYTEGKSVTKDYVKPTNEMFDSIWTMLKAKKWQEIKKIVMESTVDPRELNTFFWEKFLEEENIRGIQLCCRNEKDIAWGSDSKIIMVTSLIEIVK